MFPICKIVKPKGQLSLIPLLGAIVLTSSLSPCVSLSNTSPTVLAQEPTPTLSSPNPNISLVNTVEVETPWSITSVAISPDNKTIVSGSSDVIQVWDLDRLGVVTLKNTYGYKAQDHHAYNYKAEHPHDPVESAVINPDNKTIVSGGGDGTIKVWDLGTGTLKRTLTGHSDSVSSVAISPDNSTIVSGSYYGTIKVWDLRTGQLKRTLTGHSDSVSSVA
ncbi:MAG: hypothetical protein GDA44_08615, partial [Prochloron sp. SP5CPC1]|nr:hypothetical protein [Candidatus Paraprochloron terpiosi SP5CPC1]